MTEQQPPKEFRQGDTVHLAVEARDEHGVSDGFCRAVLEGAERDDIFRILDLTGSPGGNPEQA